MFWVEFQRYCGGGGCCCCFCWGGGGGVGGVSGGGGGDVSGGGGVGGGVSDRIKVDGQGVLVVESDASHFTYGRISILAGSGNLVGIVLRSTGDKLVFCCRALHL